MKNLKDKTAVITGASSGIGEAAAYAFARRGANIVVAARRVELLEQVKTRVEEMGVKALVVPTDVTDTWQAQRLIDATIEHFGQIDVLINNAGAGLAGALLDTPMEEIRKLFELNLFAAAQLMQAGLKTMERQGSGVIINVASTAGLLPSPYIPVYNATKAALIMLSESTNIEYLGTRIDIVAFCPHFTETAFHGAKKSFGRFAETVMVGRPASAEWVAEKLVQAALKPKPLMAFSSLATIGQLARLIAPGLYYRGVRVYRDKVRQANPPEAKDA
jgi:short-subunit dehydrogenase